MKEIVPVAALKFKEKKSKVSSENMQYNNIDNFLFTPSYNILMAQDFKFKETND